MEGEKNWKARWKVKRNGGAWGGLGDLGGLGGRGAWEPGSLGGLEGKGGLGYLCICVSKKNEFAEFEEAS